MACTPYAIGDYCTPLYSRSARFVPLQEPFFVSHLACTTLVVAALLGADLALCCSHVRRRTPCPVTCGVRPPRHPDLPDCHRRPSPPASPPIPKPTHPPL